MLQKEYSCRLILNIQFLYYHPGPSLDQLFICQLHINHFVAFYPSHFNHHSCGDHIEYHFLRGTGFQPRAACYKFRSNHDHNPSRGRSHDSPSRDVPYSTKLLRLYHMRNGPSGPSRRTVPYT